MVRRRSAAAFGVVACVMATVVCSPSFVRGAQGNMMEGLIDALMQDLKTSAGSDKGIFRISSVKTTEQGEFGTLGESYLRRRCAGRRLGAPHVRPRNHAANIADINPTLPFPFASVGSVVNNADIGQAIMSTFAPILVDEEMHTEYNASEAARGNASYALQIPSIRLVGIVDDGASSMDGDEASDNAASDFGLYDFQSSRSLLEKGDVEAADLTSDKAKELAGHALDAIDGARDKAQQGARRVTNRATQAGRTVARFTRAATREIMNSQIVRTWRNKFRRYLTEWPVWVQGIWLQRT